MSKKPEFGGSNFAREVQHRPSLDDSSNKGRSLQLKKVWPCKSSAKLPLRNWFAEDINVQQASCKVNTKGSLCSNTAAGCISRHQLVPFHSRAKPKSAAESEMYRAALKVSVLLVSDCWVIYWRLAVLFFQWTNAKNKEWNKRVGLSHFGWGQKKKKKKSLGCWTVHISCQDPRRGKSHHPKRSCWEATATEPWSRTQSCTAERERRVTRRRLQHCLLTQKQCRHEEGEGPNSPGCNIAATLSPITSHPADRPVGIEPFWVTFANFMILFFMKNQFALIDKVASISLEGFFSPISYHPSWLCMKSATMIYATAEAPRYYTLSLIKDDPLNLLIYKAVICAHREVKWEHFYTLECHHFEISSHYYSGSKSWSAPPLAARAVQASLSEPLRQMVQVKQTKMSTSKERVAAGAKKCHRKWTLPAWSTAPCSRH